MSLFDCTTVVFYRMNIRVMGGRLLRLGKSVMIARTQWLSRTNAVLVSPFVKDIASCFETAVLVFGDDIPLWVVHSFPVMRSPAPLRNPIDSLLQITLDPEPTGRNRHSKFLAQGPEWLLLPYRSYHELHSLLLNIHGAEWHLFLHSERASLARECKGCPGTKWKGCHETEHGFSRGWVRTMSMSPASMFPYLGN